MKNFDEDAGFYEIVEEYINQKGFFHFEGESGIEHLNDLTNDLGYGSSCFRHGSSLETFLADNPGAQSAIVDWIMEQDVPEWRENLEGCLDEEVD